MLKGSGLVRARFFILILPQAALSDSRLFVMFSIPVDFD